MATATSPSPETIAAFERQCRDDFPLACESLFYIRPKEEPLTRLRLNWPQQHVTQRYLLPAWERREPLALTVLKTRRVGMTTLFMAWLYHKIRWFRGQNCYVVANDEPTLAEIFLMAGRFHDNLPPELVPPVAKNNTEQLAYAPPWDSSLRARIAKYGEVGRGTTLHHVLLDEIAFYPDPAKILLGVLDAVPRTSASSLILSSTANGAETWFEAVWNEFSRHSARGQGWGGRQWQTVFLAWFMNPYNRMMGLPVFDLDSEEKELQKRYTLSSEQLAWRRATILEYDRLFPGVGRRKFMQENPSCLAGETRVGTDLGLLPIAELQGAEHTATGTLTGWYPKGQALVWKVETRLGYTVEATDDHLIKTTHCWRAVRDLKPGNVVLLSSPRFAAEPYTVTWSPFGAVQSQLTITEDVALWLGYFMGDGCFSGNTLSTTCTGEDRDVIAEVCRLYTEVWGLSPHCRTIGKQGGGVEIRAQDARLREVFAALGIIKNSPGFARHHGYEQHNVWSRKVCVPECIWRSPQPMVRAFLQGLFEADGFNGYGTPRIMLFSRYEAFLRDVQLLLLGFGITARLGVQREKQTQGHTYTGRELALRASEAERFHEQIGFRSVRKESRSYRRVLKLDGSTNRNRVLLTHEDTITAITPTRFTSVYDIGIAEGHHSFDGNGLLVHNCPEEAFQMAGDCIFGEEALAYLKAHERPPQEGYQIVKTGMWRCNLVAVSDPTTAPLQIWEPPKRERRYAIGVDVSRGVGRDDSAVVVMSMPGFRQVAHWYDNYTSPKQLAYVVAAIARHYGVRSGDEPICTVEVNDAGILVNSELETLRGVEPLEIFVWEYWDKLGTTQGSTKTGWYTSHVTKNLLVGCANSILNAKICHVPSALLRQDLGRTTEVKPGLYRTGGCDLTIAWLLALVTCYRKIARWDWAMVNAAEPGSSAMKGPMPDSPGRPDDEMDDVYSEYNDVSRHDTRWQKLMAAADTRTGVSGWEDL